MQHIHRYLTAYRPGPKGAFRAAVEPFDEEALKALLDESVALMTIGPGRHQSPAMLIERLRGLVRSQGSDLAPRTWVLLTRDPLTGRTVLRRALSSASVYERLTAAMRNEGAGAAALVATPMFDLLDEQVQRELLEKPDPEPAEEKLEVRNRDRLLAARDTLLKMVPTYSSEEIAGLRGSTTTNASQLGQDLRKAGKVVGVRHGKSWRYPRFQFDPRGVPFEEMSQVVQALGRDANPWDLLQWFVEPNEALDGGTPEATWRKNRAAVVEAARAAHWGARD